MNTYYIPLGHSRGIATHTHAVGKVNITVKHATIHDTGIMGTKIRSTETDELTKTSVLLIVGHNSHADDEIGAKGGVE